MTRSHARPKQKRETATLEITQRLLHATSRQRKYQLRHKRAGLCYDCSRPAASGTLFCELHRRKRNLENRERQRKDLSKSVGTVKLKATNSAGAKLMSMKAREFAADLQEVSDQLEASKPAPQLVVNKP
jgi:hypothetical protein